MNVLLIVFNLLFVSNLFGQIKTLHNIENADGDTSILYKYQLTVINGLSITRLDTSLSPFYFRIWQTNQALDILKDKENNCKGILTSWATEQVPQNEERTHRILITKQELKRDTADSIFALIKSSQILNLPTDDSIKGWRQGFDGINYVIEYSTATDYFLKTYWTPKIQDTALKEARFVQSFVDSAFQLSESKAIWKSFQKTIPYECYSVGMTINCKVLTKKEKRKFARERKAYRKHVNNKP